MLLPVLVSACASFAPVGHAAISDGVPSLSEIRWDRRAVEHLWNRAGFGVPDDQVDDWVAAGPLALVDHLLTPRPFAGQELVPDFEYVEPRIDPIEYELRTIDERREYRTIQVRVHRDEMARFRAAWVQRMLDGEDPLRDRMTLFWHGMFTSSYETVRLPGPIVQQHLTLRRGALGSYDALLRAMLRDPAMLIYLDNDENRKGRPNENLAREVMELFSLGQGTGYSEDDVREAARALTGAGVTRGLDGGRYLFQANQHDEGTKAILGDVGQHDADDLATILLGRPECARFVASNVIEYLEGVRPTDARVETYADLLRSTGYDIAFFLRRLFLDPAFYRDEVIGGRIASPVDFLVGSAIRSGVDVPAEFVVEASAELGQVLFQPPNVKGWEEGVAWITTASFMLRGNIAGALLGRIDRRALREDAEAFLTGLAMDGAMASMDDESMAAMTKEQVRRDEVSRLAGLLEAGSYEPQTTMARIARGPLGAATSDAAVARRLADRLLAVEPPDETLAMLEGRVRELRLGAGGAANSWLEDTARVEPLLCELAHLVFSLPEAQIH